MVYRDLKDHILTANKKRIGQLKAFLMTSLKEEFLCLGIIQNLNKLWCLKNIFDIRKRVLKNPLQFS